MRLHVPVATNKLSTCCQSRSAVCCMIGLLGCSWSGISELFKHHHGVRHRPIHAGPHPLRCCSLPHKLGTASAANSQLPASGVPLPPSGGGFKWWYGLLIAVGVVALLGLGICLALVVIVRRRRRAQSKGQLPVADGKRDLKVCTLPLEPDCARGMLPSSLDICCRERCAQQNVLPGRKDGRAQDGTD